MKGMKLAEMNKMMSTRQGQGTQHSIGIKKQKTAIILAKARKEGAKIPLK